jgi:hypothetical protein
VGPAASATVRGRIRSVAFLLCVTSGKSLLPPTSIRPNRHEVEKSATTFVHCNISPAGILFWLDRSGRWCESVYEKRKWPRLAELRARATWKSTVGDRLRRARGLSGEPIRGVSTLSGEKLTARLVGRSLEPTKSVHSPCRWLSQSRNDTPIDVVGHEACLRLRGVDGIRPSCLRSSHQ